MGKSVKKALREGYDRLKRSMEKMVNPQQKNSPQFILQPVRNRPHNKKY